MDAADHYLNYTQDSHVVASSTYSKRLNISLFYLNPFFFTYKSNVTVKEKVAILCGFHVQQNVPSQYLTTASCAGSVYFCRDTVNTKQLKVLLKATNLFSAFLFTGLQNNPALSSLYTGK